MNYSCKQKQVIGYLNQVDSATINEIYNNVSFRYYHNYKKHLGALLSRMVKSGKIKRVKRGLYSKVSLNPEFVGFMEVRKSKYTVQGTIKFK